MKLIIIFQKGQYNPVKISFKRIFSGKLKWNGVGWYSPDKRHFIRPTKKMESGQAVTFIADVPQSIHDKIIPFLLKNGIVFDKVSSFDSIPVEEEKSILKKGMSVKIDRYTPFMQKMSSHPNKKFVKRWGELIKKDDERLNKIMKTGEDIDIETIF